MQHTHLKENARHGTPDFPIGIYNMAFDSYTTMLAQLHYHSEFEFLVVTRGKIAVHTENEVYQLSEQQGLFINTNQLHMITAADEGAHGFIAIVLDYRMLCSQSEILFTKYVYPLMNGTLKITHLLKPEICSILYRIHTTYEYPAFGSEIVVKQLLLHCFGLMLKDATAEERPVHSSKSKLVKEILDYMENNYTEQITLSDMAAHVHISREYLCRIFSRMSGMSPITYLNRYRVQKSMELLLETDKSITEIAHLCGFNHSSYFNKLFLGIAGCRPTEYRKNGSDTGKNEK